MVLPVSPGFPSRIVHGFCSVGGSVNPAVDAVIGHAVFAKDDNDLAPQKIASLPLLVGAT